MPVRKKSPARGSSAKRSNSQSTATAPKPRTLRDSIRESLDHVKNSKAPAGDALCSCGWPHSTGLVSKSPSLERASLQAGASAGANQRPAWPVRTPRFIRIGDRIVNLDQVRSILFDRDGNRVTGAWIEFASKVGTATGSWHLGAEDAAALLALFDQAVDVLNLT